MSTADPPACLVDPASCLHVGDLRLRAWRPADATALFEAVRESLDHLGRWLPWCRADYDMDAARAWIAHCDAGWKRDEHYAFAVFDADGGLLGGIGLNQRNRLHRSANLGYWVRHARIGHGTAARAARGVALFGFEQLGLQRIEILAMPDNHASRRSAERCGARYEGIARQRLQHAGQACDAAVYALIPSDLLHPPLLAAGEAAGADQARLDTGAGPSPER